MTKLPDQLTDVARLSLKDLVQWLELEPDPNFPFLYWIEDLKAIQLIASKVMEQPFGLETGFGDHPTKVDLISQEVNWLLTEDDPEIFNDAKKALSDYWTNSAIPKSPDFKIFALCTVTPREMYEKAQVLVFRNFNYNTMYVPHFKGLHPGQRLVVIIDQAHSVDIGRYSKELLRRGYDPQNLQLRPADLPPLSCTHPSYRDELVLDLTRK